MANNLATLSSKLATALRDTAHTTWNSTEKDDLVTWAVASLYPRYVRSIDPTTTTIPLVSSTYFYALPTGVVEISNIDLYNATTEYGPLNGQAWQIAGDIYAGTGKLRLAPSFANTGDTLRLHGYGIYDTTTNLIPDRLVPLISAKARSEAYRRMAGDRARYEKWATTNQKQNVSVNELILLINEADNEALRLDHVSGVTRRLPVPGRLA